MPRPRRHGGARSREWVAAARLGFSKISNSNPPSSSGLVRTCALGPDDPVFQSVSVRLECSSLRAKRSNPGPQARTGLLRRYAPRNDGETHFRILATPTARVLQIIRPIEIEGAGNAGCPRHPQPRVVVKNTRVSHHRYPGTPGIPCAIVLTGSFVLSPATGLCCHRHPQEACFSRA
jgi:hypothetical protein